jgi:two-component system sensor histidine kinase DesK
MTHDTICRHGRFLAWAAPIFGLLWLVVPVADFAAGSDPAAWQIALVAVGLPVFGWQFLEIVTLQRPLLRPLAGMLALSVALTLTAYDGFALMFVWAASAAAVRLEGRANLLAVAAVTALAAGTLALTDPDAAAFWGITATVFATGALWLLIGGLLRANTALREARAELADLAVAEERLRFARDLHDLLGHSLSLIALKAELARRLLPARTDDAAREIDDIRALTRSALGDVREAVGGYRRPTLPSELAGARVALEAAGIDLRVNEPDLALDPDAESVLAWAIREGATNMIRHSGAGHAEITLRPGRPMAELEIADDGKGITNGTGDGLAGLRERAAAVGGTVETLTGPDGGFRLRVSVPAHAA